MEIPLPTSRYDISRAVAPKCLDDPPVDRDRRNAHPGSKATQGLLILGPRGKFDRYAILSTGVVNFEWALYQNSLGAPFWGSLAFSDFLPTEIGSRVGRNQTTVMRICDRWMQEGTTDRRGRSHPPQCITSREDRQIVRMAVTDRSVTSRTVAQHIESVTHHSVSARTIRCRL
ncbi:transposable element Tcb1 transposase [Trichonephila clavipes]|nr:transposable element Tcb1 transposase [Trichonephila clavipes]